MSDDEQFWVDHMVEKHECFHFPVRSESIQVDGAEVELLVPKWAAEFEVVEANQSNKKLFLILRDLTTEGWDDNLGIIAIAVRQDDERYAVIFWHATYPYLWKYL